MPKVLEVNVYTFRFYSNENNEDAHIHYSKRNGNSSFGWYRKSGMLIPMVSLSENKETLKT